MGEFKRYTHVERLGTEECEGLLDNDRVFVTAKVDGSNGCVWWDAGEGRLAYGSRNYDLTAPDVDDNAHFRAWCESAGEEQDALRAFCEGHPTLVIYGEWMGRDRFVGAFKGYDRRALGSLAIFDVFDCETGLYLSDDVWRPMLAEAGLEPWFVRVLAVLDHPTVDDVLAVAKANDFLLEGSGLVGEGVVCKVASWRNRFGRQVYGKLVLDEFKKQRRKRVANEEDIEQGIVDWYMTDAELSKTVAKVCARCGAEEFDPASRKMAGMLGGMCWRDLLEECPNWVKRFKNPKVDFARLSGLCSARVKEYAGIA